MHKVWFRKYDGWWYATLKQEGRQHQLKLVKAPHTADGRKQAEAQLLDELKAIDYTPDDSKIPSWITVANVIDGFLRHSKQEHSSETHGWYGNLLTPFKKLFGTLRVPCLKRKQVLAWLKGSGYNPTSQNKALGALKRAFNWAVEEEHIPKNPIAHVRKPKPITRDRLLEPGERELILTSIKDEAFRRYVQALTLTGCRPGEASRVRPEEVNLELGVWVLERHKTSRKTGKPRVIYLCPEALELTKRLMSDCPAGRPLFLNRRGRPWTRNAVRQRFRRLRKKFPQLKGVVAYTYRGSFATDALEREVPDATVSALLGHSNTDTLHRYYARLSSRANHLKDAARKATRPAGGDALPSATP
jgi:integrase